MVKKTARISGHFKRNTVVAALTLCLDYGVFLYTKRFVDSAVALVIGYCSGLVLNYLLSSWWVFNERRFKSTARQFSYFTAAALSGLGVELLFFYLYRLVIPAPVARLLSIGTAYFWNFAIKELIVFRRARPVRFKHIRRCYSGLTAIELVYLYVRWVTAPLEIPVSRLPSSGVAYEFGCGSGINLVIASLLHPALKLYGSDIDAKKLLLARKICLPAITVSKKLPSRQADGYLIADVLYLLSWSRTLSILESAVRHTKPGGIIVIKEMSATPAWKARWNIIQERISTRLTKMTKSEDQVLEVTTTSEISAWAASHNLHCTVSRLDRHYVHPHSLAVITKSDGVLQ